jgi:RecA-family ATPase
MKDWDEAGRAGVDILAIADAASSKPKQNGKASSGWREHAYTASDLLGMEFPEINYIVPGIIPEGLSILAGRPKVGKSWMALEVSLGVTTGTHVLGKIDPLEGDVLYCGLEDNPRRMQRRLHKLTWPPTGKWPERLTMAHRWQRLDDGGVDDIADWVASVSQPRLAVLDTLAGVRPERSRQDTTYDGDYKALVDAHRLANEKGFSILVLHHARKQEADDPLDGISGTFGIVGCADTGLVLARGPQGATLYARGRDIEEVEHAISFSKDTCRWTILGEAAEVQMSETRKKIRGVLQKAKEPIGPNDIADAADLSRDVVRKRLGDMVEKGEAVLVSRGRYASPSYTPITTVTSSLSSSK